MAATKTETERLAAARKNYEAAVAFHRAGALAEAERHYQAVRRLFPGHPGALHGLGLICLRTDRPEEAAAMLSGAAAAAPQNGAIRRDLGSAYLALGRYGEAARSFEAAIKTRPDDAQALLGLGDALSVLGQVDAARSAFQKVLAADSRNGAAHFGLGGIAAQTGRMAEARSAFERAIACAPKHAAYHRALAETARFVAGDTRLDALETLAREARNLGDAQKVELHFALAKAYDDLARYDDAFTQLQSGNTLKRTLVSYDEAAVADFFREIAQAFSSSLMPERVDAGDPSDTPVFVVGMPRSGSTMVEQILASHPDVHGAGELLVMNDLVADLPNYPAGIASMSDAAFGRFGQRYVAQVRALAPGAKRIVDKLPANFRHLGMIRLVLPNAKIVHVRRDPMDTCLSCYSKLFLGGLNFAYDLGELGRYHKMVEALMAHWRAVLPKHALLDVEYETLVGDFEAQARRIVAFCGLEWDARCLDFSRTERPVRTLSQAQVRQPLFASSIGRWRHYEKHLGPLIAALR
ncbi:MAG: sulfotransferase [Rhizomicrobium sp.]